MASDLIVPVVEVKNVRIHPNADMLSICEVLGYQMVNGLVENPDGEIVRTFMKDVRDERGRRVPYEDKYTHTRETEEVRYSFRYKDGDKAVYFPADTILSDALAEEFEVKHLLKSDNRVGRAKLRGEPSFGLIVALPEGVDWKVGQNVAEHYDVKKFVPPPPKELKDIALYDAEIDPYFIKYTDLQNGLLLYETFTDGEEVIATEKIHGMNCRVGLVNDTLCVGSRTTRKDAERERDKSVFWPVAENKAVIDLLNYVKQYKSANIVILFGEVFGQGVQSLHYGFTGKRKGFRAFDLCVDDYFLDYDEFEHFCSLCNVPTAPLIYRGGFDLEKIQEISNGKTTLPLGNNIREGVVVRSAKERRDAKIGRVVLKFISPEYDLSKHKKKDTTDL